MLSTTLQHGIIMAITWTICIPIGMFIARYFTYMRHWLKCHIIVQTFALTLTITGFVLALYLVQTENSTHFSAQFNHGKLGLFVVTGIIFQYIIGIFRPKYIKNSYPTNAVVGQIETVEQTETLNLEKNKPIKRKVFEIQHRALAIALLLIAYWNIHTGINLASDELDSSLWQKILIGTAIGTGAFVFVFDMYKVYFL